MFICWLFLIISIVLEVSGTSIMKASQAGFPVLGLMIMYVLFGLSYLSLSKAVTRIPVGVAYSFWEGAGLVLITLVSFLFFHEPLGPKRIIAIVMLLLGSYLVHRGTENHAGEAGK